MRAVRRVKRGLASRQLRVLEALRPLLRSEVDPERMLRSVAALVARSGNYCIADFIDSHGTLRCLEIAHADAGRQVKLRIAAEATRLSADGRVARLLRSGDAQLVSRVPRTASAESGDIVLLHGEPWCSYMAAAISVAGSAIAALTVVATRATVRFDAEDLEFLRVVADWTGLGLENALRREAQPTESVAPPSLTVEDERARPHSPTRRR
jgi:GAF domain-containing protein